MHALPPYPVAMEILEITDSIRAIGSYQPGGSSAHRLSLRVRTLGKRNQASALICRRAVGPS